MTFKVGDLVNRPPLGIPWTITAINGDQVTCFGLNPTGKKMITTTCSATELKPFKRAGPIRPVF